MENQEMSATMQERVKAALTDRLGMFTRSDAQRARFMQYCVYISVAVLLVLSAMMIIVFPIVFDSFYARAVHPINQDTLTATTAEKHVPIDKQETTEMIPTTSTELELPTEVDISTTEGQSSKNMKTTVKPEKKTKSPSTTVTTRKPTTTEKATTTTTSPTTTVPKSTTSPPSTTTTTRKTTTTPLSPTIPHWWRLRLSFSIPQPCKRGAKYLHVNCRKYHTCMTDFTLHEAQCPGGTMFNPRSKKCDLEKYVHEFCYRVRLTEPEPPVQRRIITTTTTEAPETTTPPPLFNPPIPCETNSLFPHVNCTLFYKCGDNGFPSVLTCPPSREAVIGTLFYNERTKTCDQFNNVPECTMGAHRTVAVNLMNQFNPPFPCKNGHVYPHPDCKKYYTCVGEVPTEKTCLQQFKRMHFTTKGGGCVDATKTLLSGECNNSDERQIVFRKGDGDNNNVEDTNEN